MHWCILGDGCAQIEGKTNQLYVPPQVVFSYTKLQQGFVLCAFAGLSLQVFITFSIVYFILFCFYA